MNDQEKALMVELLNKLLADGWTDETTRQIAQGMLRKIKDNDETLQD